MLKTAFCKYLTSAKIKSNMTCVYKDTKSMKLKQKSYRSNEFLLGYNMKIVI